MKKITLLAGLTLLCQIALAQNVPNRYVTETNADLSDDVAYALENLDMTDVTSDYSCKRAATSDFTKGRCRLITTQIIDASKAS